jgi:beta-glucosidase-like glycosyl hydrolase
VLLKNKAPAGSSKPLLPLDKSSLKKLCVLGPLAHSAEHMMGNYYGNFDAKLAATPLQGIQEELGKRRAVTARLCGCSCANHAFCDCCVL